MSTLPSSWSTLAIQSAAVAALAAVSRYSATLRPVPDLVFRAFEKVSPAEAKCIILGLDPYPTPGDAMGLSFSVPGSTAKLPPTLRNIMKEFAEDLGAELPSPDLTSWAEQGVLLANTALTMAGGKSGEHLQHWEQFTNAWITYLQELDRPCVWILWGNDAKLLRPLIQGTNQRIIESPHPSPLSAYRGFWGTRPFSKCNDLLAAMGEPQIDWLAPAK